uniref:Uncharacterized protein n=1 Tax=Rhizophora mucronata TaxID=61149 RepID=A0A2P2N6Q3_RHIMU
MCFDSNGKIKISPV